MPLRGVHTLRLGAHLVVKQSEGALSVCPFPAQCRQLLPFPTAVVWEVEVPASATVVSANAEQALVSELTVVRRVLAHEEADLSTGVAHGPHGTRAEFLGGKRHGLQVDRHGTRRWFAHGLQHREGGAPSTAFTCGIGFWKRHSKFAREGGRPVVAPLHN